MSTCGQPAAGSATRSRDLSSSSSSSCCSFLLGLGRAWLIGDGRLIISEKNTCSAADAAATGVFFSSFGYQVLGNIRGGSRDEAKRIVFLASDQPTTSSPIIVCSRLAHAASAETVLKEGRIHSHQMNNKRRRRWDKNGGGVRAKNRTSHAAPSHPDD